MPRVKNENRYRTRRNTSTCLKRAARRTRCAISRVTRSKSYARDSDFLSSSLVPSPRRKRAIHPLPRRNLKYIFLHLFSSKLAASRKLQSHFDVERFLSFLWNAKGERTSAFFLSVKHASATTLVIERARKYAVVLSCNGRGRRLASSSRRVVATARRVSPPPPPPPPSSPSSRQLTFFSAKVASRAWVFRSDDDDGDGDDDDDSNSGSGSDAVIQYGSLHTCQNKRTENERAIGTDSNRPSRILRRRRHVPTRRVDGCREIALIVQRRYNYARIRGDKGRGEKKGERVALPRAQRDTYAASARHRLPADVPDGRCGTRSGGSRRDFSDAQPRPGVLSMPFTLVCIIFTYLYFIFEYNAASLPFHVLLFFQVRSSFSVWFFNA